MYSLDRYIVNRDGTILDKQKNNQPIKTFKSNKYLQCCIFDDNGKHVTGVHNVVAQALSADWFEGCVVHHKDNNPHNNNINNLECLDLKTHVSIHQQPKYKDTIKICPCCNKEFIWTAYAQKKHYGSKRKLGPFCSQSCAGKYFSSRH